MNGKDRYIVTVSILHFDEYFLIDSWPQEGSKAIIRPIKRIPGGSVANASCVLSALGSSVYFYDILSSSSDNDYLLQDLENNGVNTQYVTRVDNLLDSKCLIILDEAAERTVLHVQNLKPTLPLTDEQCSLLMNASYIYTSMGAQYLFPEYCKSIKMFQQNGVKLALDVEYGFSDPMEVEFLEQADILFFNQFGFSQNAGKRDEQEYVDYLLKCGVEIVIMTMGERGCKIFSLNKSFEIPAFKVNIIDPNGAGDTFNASFLHCLCANRTIYEAAKFASAAASYCISGFGPRYGAISDKDVDFILHKYEKGEN